MRIFLLIIGLAGVMAMAAILAFPALYAHFGPRSHVTVHNVGDEPIEDLIISYGRETYAVDEIGPGESLEYRPRRSEGVVTLSYLHNGAPVEHLLYGYVPGGVSHTCEATIDGAHVDGGCEMR